MIPLRQACLSGTDLGMAFVALTQSLMKVCGGEAEANLKTVLLFNELIKGLQTPWMFWVTYNGTLTDRFNQNIFFHQFEFKHD